MIVVVPGTLAYYVAVGGAYMREPSGAVERLADALQRLYSVEGDPAGGGRIFGVFLKNSKQ